MSTSQSLIRRTPKQRSIRKRVEGLELESAVLAAVRSLFRFTHRAAVGKALWSDTQVVWLGRSTYLHWCLDDPEFDIPWIVARSAGAPRERELLRKRVQSLVLEFYASQLSGLPSRKTGKWLPLP